MGLTVLVFKLFQRDYFNVQDNPAGLVCSGFSAAIKCGSECVQDGPWGDERRILWVGRR